MAETLPHNLVATTSICKNHTAVQKMKPPKTTSIQMVGAWMFACWDPWCPIVDNTWNVDSFDRWSSQNSCIYHYIPTKNWTWMPFCRPASPFGGSSKFSWWKIPVQTCLVLTSAWLVWSWTHILDFQAVLQICFSVLKIALKLPFAKSIQNKTSLERG